VSLPVAAFDTMLGLPPDRANWRAAFGNLVRDPASESLRQPAGFLFKDLPEVDEEAFEDVLVAEMDRWNIEAGLVPVSFADDDLGRRLVSNHPQRFRGSFSVDPNRAGDADQLERAVRELGVRAATCFPCGTNPQVAIDGAAMYPLYAQCVKLGVPIFVNAGMPGPRMPAWPQDVRRLDDVCYDFPDLVVVTRHGCEPWADLAVKLMLKWPGLHYSTSAFAPKHYPAEIIAYANTRGADKVMYGGYFPYGLTLERIFTELPAVPLRDAVWPKFLRENARRVLGIGS
jgi:predicted TIM-barrel fold metal-dependent hydrolase